MLLVAAIAVTAVIVSGSDFSLDSSVDNTKVIGSKVEKRARVVDSATGEPIARASVFDNRGNMIGVCSDQGALPAVSRWLFPVTIRVVGYENEVLDKMPDSDVKMREASLELPEVTVGSKNHEVLHILAYVREYSTISVSYDTVALFREKLVDFMVPSKKVRRYAGWMRPRVLTSRSYYHFTNYEGLDSVSRRFPHHFSWSDWVGVAKPQSLPAALLGDEPTATDTLRGKYSPREIWKRRGETVRVDVDMLADSVGKVWAPPLYNFIYNGVEFTRMNLQYLFADVSATEVRADNLVRYSMSVQSKGRGEDQDKIFRSNEPVYADTYAEVYVIDKEYVSVGEAKKREHIEFKSDEIDIMVPDDAPELPASIVALVERGNNINEEALRLDEDPDQSYVGRHILNRKREKKIKKLLRAIFR